MDRPKNKYQAGIDFQLINSKHGYIGYPLDNKIREQDQDTLSRYVKLVKELIEGKKVIEIGAASAPQVELFKFNPLEYICVEPAERRWTGEYPSFFKYAHKEDFWKGYDGVEYLQEHNEPVSIVSSGVIDTCVLKGEEYREELVKLIYDRTPQNGLTLHTISSSLESLFIDVGFRLELAYGAGIEHSMAEMIIDPESKKFVKPDGRANPWQIVVGMFRKWYHHPP